MLAVRDLIFVISFTFWALFHRKSKARAINETHSPASQKKKRHLEFFTMNWFFFFCKEYLPGLPKNGKETHCACHTRITKTGVTSKTITDWSLLGECTQRVQSSFIFFISFQFFWFVCFFTEIPKGKIEFKKLAVTLGEATSYEYLSNSELKPEY